MERSSRLCIFLNLNFIKVLEKLPIPEFSSDRRSCIDIARHYQVSIDSIIGLLRIGGTKWLWPGSKNRAMALVRRLTKIVRYLTWLDGYYPKTITNASFPSKDNP
jgi:hypothetical protein